MAERGSGVRRSPGSGSGSGTGSSTTMWVGPATRLLILNFCSRTSNRSRLSIANLRHIWAVSSPGRNTKLARSNQQYETIGPHHDPAVPSPSPVHCTLLLYDLVSSLQSCSKTEIL